MNADLIARLRAAPILSSVAALYDLIDEAADALEQSEAGLREAAKLISKLAREAGEAQGRLEASEMAGVVEAWRERAEAAEARLAALTDPGEKTEPQP